MKECFPWEVRPYLPLAKPAPPPNPVAPAPPDLPEVPTPTKGIGVYFVVGGDRVKIGFSKQPAFRLAALRCGSPVPLRLVGWLPGTRILEQVLHEEWAGHRTHGEWFQLDEVMAAFIRFAGTDEEFRANCLKSRYPLRAEPALLSVRLAVNAALQTQGYTRPRAGLP